MNKKIVFISIFFFIVFTFSSYISGPFSILRLLLSLTIYLLVSFIIYTGWKKFRKKEYLKIKDFTVMFLYKVSSVFSVLIFLGLSFTYYQNDLKPAQMPSYVISNGEKTVYFQSMSHIGSERFYNDVIENIKILKNKGYVLFYEGVRSGTTENNDGFNKALGINLIAEENIYENFSKLYGVIEQKNIDLLGIVNNKDFNIDLNIDEIMKFYNDKIEVSNETTNESKIKEVKIPVDINKEILDVLVQLKPRELEVLRYVNKSILNFIIKNDAFRNTILNNIGNGDLFEIILGKRNELLADEITNSEYDKIVITYGLMHFSGVLELLKDKDSNWKIKETHNLYPIVN